MKNSCSRIDFDVIFPMQSSEFTKSKPKKKPKPKKKKPTIFHILYKNLFL